MIYYNKEEKIFYLHTEKTSYVIGLRASDNAPIHLYWGKRLNNSVNTELLKRSERIYVYEPPFEYSTYGSPDYRYPSFEPVYASGSTISKPLYNGFEIVQGKPGLQGLPSVYTEEGDKAETLIIKLHDELENTDISLIYTVLEDFDAITRSVLIKNNGDTMRLEKVMSATVDFYACGKKDFVHLDGAWGRERHIVRNRITTGNQNIESRYGASSPLHNPFFAVCDSKADEQNGEVYGFSLVYSGNHTGGVEVNQYNSCRAYIGINPFNFSWVLENGESFQTPEAVLVYSPEGFGGMSRIYHKLYRKRLCRGKFRDTLRYVVVNNWEATYFNFNADKIVSIAEKAAEIGADAMVLDDGWFGKRNDDTSSLGDWYENKEKLPEGLEGLAKRINALGLKFGLWMEPEMVCPVSELYKKHPEWVLQTKGRQSTPKRNQYILDLSREDVCDFIIKTVCGILDRVNVEYFKWDMNRYMSETGSLLLPPEHQGEVMHRYILGLYRVIDTVTSKYPGILFESCAGGGGRFDPGMFYYMPQTWLSDDTDAVERLYIQYGTSYVYPYSVMGAHVSACPNHQVGRTTPFEMRCNVAMPGQYGFELDLNKCSDKELETAREAIKAYKALQPIFHDGDCYRLVSPYENNYSAIEFLATDKNTIILCLDSIKATPDAQNEYIKLQGLDENAQYISEENGELYGGDYLMYCGILYVNSREHNSRRIIFKKVK